MYSVLKPKLEKAIADVVPLSVMLLKKMEDVDIEIGRRAKLVDMLIKIGFSKNDADILKVLKKAIEEQREDGGWGSIEESLICLRFISNYREDENIKGKVEKAIEWVLSSQNNNGGWGRCVRDRSRIPMTFRVVELFYKLGIKKNTQIRRAYEWMEKEWGKDIAFSGLSYKASGILITNKLYKGMFSEDIINKTLNWLIKDQNEDGGWGPNKYSPIGSTSIYTSLVVRALINYQDEKTDATIEKGINWILLNQLEGGQWKEHPPEDGVINCVEVLNIILNKFNT